MKCNGRMVNGPDKRYALCGSCGTIDYEANEGDLCQRGDAGVMTPDHPQWRDFVALLEGPEGCDFRDIPPTSPGGEGSFIWRCGGGRDKSKAIDILMKHFPGVSVDQSLSYFDAHGGHCDCEILFNVEPVDAAALAEAQHGGSDA
jgi:hypothetical protein